MAAVERPRETAAALARTFGEYPFTLLQSEQAGVTPGALRAAVRRGLIDHLAFNSYSVAGSALSDREIYLKRVCTALARRWSAVGSHESAAAALALPNPRFVPWQHQIVVVTNPDTRTRLRRGILSLQRPRDPGREVRTAWGPVTDMERTAYDLASSRPLKESLVIVDAVARALHPGGDREAYLDPAERRRIRDRLVRMAESCPDPENHELALSVLRRAEPAAESPVESVSRAHVITHGGLPLPTVGARVVGGNGRTYYGDLVWEEERVIGEVDGVKKYTDPQVLVAEKEREDSLREAGWRFARWTGDTAAHQPRVFLERLRRLLLADEH